MSAAQIGVALKGRRNGSGWLVSCPCPNHGKGRGDRNPSLSVDDGDDDRLLLCCFAGCDFGDILDEMKYRGLVDDDRALDRPARAEARSTEPEPEPEPDPDALDIWRPCIPHHPIVAEYLERRGIPFPAPVSLRGQVDRPAMVAAVQRPDGKIIAVQQTWLTRDGEKAAGPKPRHNTGLFGTGAVRLGPAAEVLGLAEGVETGLSAMQLTGVTVWCCLGKRMHKVWLPPEVKVVHLFVDNDTSGRKATELTAEVHTRAGRTVVLRPPPSECNDWNDFLNLIADTDGRYPLSAEAAA